MVVNKISNLPWLDDNFNSCDFHSDLNPGFPSRINSAGSVYA